MRIDVNTDHDGSAAIRRCLKVGICTSPDCVPAGNL
jgi:hypothetical protein